METRYFNQISTAMIHEYLYLRPTHSSIHANIKSRKGAIQLLPLAHISFLEKTLIRCVPVITRVCSALSESTSLASCAANTSSHVVWRWRCSHRMPDEALQRIRDSDRIQIQIRTMSKLKRENVWSRLRGKANQNREYHSIFKRVH